MGGGTATSYLTGPDGDRHFGFWRIVEVDQASRLLFEDGFADEHGQPTDTLPGSRIEVRIDGRPDRGTRMTVTSTFESAEAMERLLAMGMAEGLRLSVGQTDVLLA